MSNLINLLPKYERNSKTLKDLAIPIEAELGNISSTIEDIEKQFSIDTATWGLSLEEKDLDIPTNIDKTLEERRGAIKAKNRGNGKASSTLIKSTIEAYTRSPVDVRFDGTIRVSSSNQNAISLNMEDMCKTIEDIKPAHIGATLNVLFEKKHAVLVAYPVRLKNRTTISTT